MNRKDSPYGKLLELQSINGALDRGKVALALQQLLVLGLEERITSAGFGEDEETHFFNRSYAFRNRLGWQARLQRDVDEKVGGCCEMFVVWELEKVRSGIFRKAKTLGS